MASPQPRVGVVTYPGSQDDRDALWALAALDAEAVPVWHEEHALPDVDAVVLPGGAPDGEGQIVPLDRQPHVAAHEAERLVAQQRPRQQARLAEDLEAVADPEHEPACLRELAHGGGRRREAGDRATAEVVAVREAAG